MRNPLIIRADASLAMGTGHVMRCLALAQAWQDAGGDVVFAMAEAPPATEERIRLEHARVVPVEAPSASPQDARQVARLAQDCQAEWIVVDGYHFGASYQRNLKQEALKVLFVDDNVHAEHYFADLVLNQNARADEADYVHRELYTNVLAGPRYALLRREFLAWCEVRREVPAYARKILVTMGGSDPGNVTLRVIQALQMVHVEGLQAKIVVGSSNPHSQSLADAASRLEGRVQLLKDTPHMPDLMAWADVAISAGGGTCYELALLQTPMFLITMAGNHERACEVLAERGIAISAGWFHLLDRNKLARALEKMMGDRELRRRLVNNGRCLVDGKGAARVVESMTRAGMEVRERASVS
jgi:UDP-2,4-diacetamido-2,4,6-trideoxy-beta-L-altropyranose hydrolase